MNSFEQMALKKINKAFSSFLESNCFFSCILIQCYNKLFDHLVLHWEMFCFRNLKLGEITESFETIVPAVLWTNQFDLHRSNNWEWISPRRNLFYCFSSDTSGPAAGRLPVIVRLTCTSKALSLWWFTFSMWMENDSEVHGGKMMHASKMRVLKGHLLFPVSEFGIIRGWISPERARFRASHRRTSLNTDTNSTSSQNNRLVTDCATDVLKDCLFAQFDAEVIFWIHDTSQRLEHPQSYVTGHFQVVVKHWNLWERKWLWTADKSQLTYCSAHEAMHVLYTDLRNMISWIIHVMKIPLH